MTEYFGVVARACPRCGVEAYFDEEPNQPHSGRWLDKGEGDYFVWHVCVGGEA